MSPGYDEHSIPAGAADAWGEEEWVLLAEEDALLEQGEENFPAGDDVAMENLPTQGTEEDIFPEAYPEGFLEDEAEAGLPGESPEDEAEAGLPEGFLEDEAEAGLPGEFPEDMAEAEFPEESLEDMAEAELPEESPEDMTEAEIPGEPLEDMTEADFYEEDIQELAADGEIPTSGSCGKYGNNVKWNFFGGGLWIEGTGEMAEYDYDDGGALEDDPDDDEDLPFDDEDDPDFDEMEDSFPWADLRDQITSVTVKDGVTSISAAAFWNCERLAHVIIGKDVAVIGEQAFFFDENLQTVHFNASDEEKNDASLAALPQVTIGDYAFDNCSMKLKKMILPKKTVSIGRGCFDNCAVLEEVSLGDNLKTIGAEAFWQCESLYTVILPETVEKIGAYAFSECAFLEREEDDWLELRFLGDFPEIVPDETDGNTVFDGTTVRAYYPARAKKFTDEIINNHGYGKAAHIEWIPGLPQVENVKIAEACYSIFLSWDKVDFGLYEEGKKYATDSKGYGIEWSEKPDFPEGQTETMMVLPEDANTVNEVTGEEFCTCTIEKLKARTKYYVRIYAYAVCPKWEEDGDYSQPVDIIVGKTLHRWAYQAEDFRSNDGFYNTYEYEIFTTTKLPCYTLVNTAISEKKGMDLASNGWEYLKTLISTADDVSTLIDGTGFSRKDVYEGIIFSVFADNTLVSDHGRAVKGMQTADELYKDLYDFLTEVRRFESASNIDFVNLPFAERTAICDHMKPLLEEKFNMLGKVNNVAGVLDKAFRAGNNLMEAINYCVNYYQLQQITDSHKDLLRELRDRCDSETNADLKAALAECCTYMDQASEDLFVLLAEKGTKTAVAISVNVLWDKVKTIAAAANPWLAGLLAILQAGKTTFFVMDSVAGVSDINAAYIEMKAVIELEALMRETYLAREQAYVNNKQTIAQAIASGAGDSVADEAEIYAQSYIEAGDLLMALYVKDYASALAFVEACDSSIASKFFKAWDSKKDHTTVKKNLAETRDIFMNHRYDFMVRWIYSVSSDYGEEEFKRYRYLLAEEWRSSTPMPHDWDAGKVTKEPTCGKAGRIFYTCKDCGATKEESIKATGKHTYGAWETKELPTLTKNGIRFRTCSVCGHMDFGELNKLHYEKDGYRTTRDNSLLEVIKPGEMTCIGPVGKGLSSAVIPDSVVVNGLTYKVTAIAPNAFKNNKKLKKVTGGANVTTIGDNAFYGCTALKSILMSPALTVIGKNAFCGCTSLKSIIIPSGVTTIGSKAFYKCKKLLTIRIKSSVLKKIGAKAFKKTGSAKVKKLKVYVPKKKKNKYKKMLKKAKLSAKAKIKKM